MRPGGVVSLPPVVARRGRVDAVWKHVISPAEADALAVRLLGDLRTKLGGPHIAHARRVAARVADTGDDSVIAAALLHDVVEKGRISVAELLTATGDVRVVELVEVLTQREGESDYDYLSRCAAHPAALAIMRVDLLDKFVADDSEVPAATAERVRRRAGQRLALLERLALRSQD